MADFDAQIQESQKQVAEAQAKISAVTAQIETARTKLDQGLSIDVENGAWCCSTKLRLFWRNADHARLSVAWKSPQI